MVRWHAACGGGRWALGGVCSSRRIPVRRDYGKHGTRTRTRHGAESEGEQCYWLPEYCTEYSSLYAMAGQKGRKSEGEVGGKSEENGKGKGREGREGGAEREGW